MELRLALGGEDGKGHYDGLTGSANDCKETEFPVVHVRPVSRIEKHSVLVLALGPLLFAACKLHEKHSELVAAVFFVSVEVQQPSV